jgi:uncharacterized protein YcnI
MYSRLLSIAAIITFVPSLLFAHVTVRPRDSAPGAEEKYGSEFPQKGPGRL